MEVEAIAIVGPTASGKTGRAVHLAGRIGSEIISADSRQIYRDMDLGTGKDLDEYGDVRYHLIDIAEAGSQYNLHQYLRDFNAVYSDLRSRNIMPVICGGSGMYIENALNGIKLPEVPENRELREQLKNCSLDELTEILAQYKTLHNKTDVDTVKRALRALEIARYYEDHPEEAAATSKKTATPIRALVIGVDIDRESRRKRITERLYKRLEDGMIDEVQRLLDNGIAPESLIYYGLEYKFLTYYLIGRLSRQEMIDKLEIAIHQFAKRQMTWFRGMEQRGYKIHWLPYDMPEDDFTDAVLNYLSE